MKILIYGAYGYTGELIAREMVQRGHRPILAGRNVEKLEPLAKELELEFLAFSLEDMESLDNALNQVEVVIHCAGPFIHTAAIMVEACIRTRTHYLDITGEIEVFELVAKKGKAAKMAGIMLLPGTGYDVVPSDCLAAHLKKRLPTGDRLRMAIYSKGSTVSHGTAATMAESFGKGSLIRKDGKIIKVPAAWRVIEVTIEGKRRSAACIPWGDVSTAWYSTAIPNIETYAVSHPKTIRWMKIANYFNWLLRSRFIQRIMRRRIDKKVTGPSAGMRKKARSYVWGEITDGKGNRRISVVACMDGYTLTAKAATRIAEKVLAGDFKSGFQTPSLAYGENLILEFEGSEFRDLM